MFIDHVQIVVQAGHGGNGCDSYFHRTDRKLIPHGGDGGDGGSVIFRADVNAPGLDAFRYRQHLKAELGTHGGPTKKRGRNGEDLVVLVPPGTRIFDSSRKLLIRNLANAGDEVVVCQGGKGGVGNLGGKKAMSGEKAPEVEIELKLLLRSDVFLVGIPNSGKSKILNTLTRSKAKEDLYPFTTRSPEKGVLSFEIEEPITLCELPSIYEGSDEGRGLGADFLKHLEEGKMILLVVDPVSDFAENLQEAYDVLKEQIGKYSEDFLKIPHAVVVNKMDLPEAAEKAKKGKIKTTAPVFYISALTGEGLPELIRYMAKNVPRLEKTS